MAKPFKGTTDKALEFIKDAKAIAPDKPFFLYYAPGACHAPHHVPKDWIDKFRGRFDMGYEAMREQTLARQKEMGIVPPDTELPPVNPIGTPQTRLRGPNGSVNEMKFANGVTGILSLYHGDRKVGEATIRTQLGAFAIVGSALCVGQDPGEPITEDYPGTPPCQFTGGVIGRVAIGVSGEPYHDLEREAALMLMRE
jgi:hypothetical protein